MLKKVDVNGDDAAPVWEWMKASHPGMLGLKRIKWNFEKFLIGPDGKVKSRWGSVTKPESLKEPILQEINAAVAAAAAKKEKKVEPPKKLEPVKKAEPAKAEL